MQIFRAVSSLRRPFALGLAAGCSVFLLPLLLLLFGANEEPTVLPPETPPILTPAPTPSFDNWDDRQHLNVLLDGGAVVTMPMADYLWRVVAAEMPAEFELEALKAQAVCARTYTLWKKAAARHEAEGADICADSSCCQAYMDPAKAAARWGEQTEAFTSKIAQAIDATDGQLLLYEGAPIQAVFFSSSTDTTEDAAAVWGNNIPYLVSVESPEGDEVPNYRSTVSFTAEEVQKLAQAAGLSAKLSSSPSNWITDLSYTSSGRVAELKLGGITLSGGAVRTLFGLRSTCFSVDAADGTFTFSVTGYGHGVGMSQYGANAMAKDGKTWQDIVTHYYTGVELQPAPAP